MKISIIIPAYNEEKRIGNTLDNYIKYFKDLKKKEKGLQYEFVIVINNTKDSTPKIVNEFCRLNKEVICLNFRQGGKGFAVIEGFKNSLKRRNNDLIGFVDADMSTNPDAYFDLIKNINGYDGIIASRYVKGANVHPKQTIKRIIASRIFNFWIKIFLGIKYEDTQCGAKIFKRKSIEKIINQTTMTQWAFDAELLYLMKKNKLKIIEWPTIWSDKGDSHIHLFRAGSRMASSVIRLRLYHSPFRFVNRIYDKLPEFLKFHHMI